MTRDDAIAEVNRVFDYLDANDRRASGFACVVVHHQHSGGGTVATTGMVHTNGLGPILMLGVEALVEDARPKLLAPPKVTH